MNNIGLCGSHRTGKTTLAKALAALTKLNVISTQTSAVFASHGLDPAQHMDFTKRLWIQEKILDAAEELWDMQPQTFIADRTPLDMLAYTLADIQGDTEVELQVLQVYTERCFTLTKRFFSQIVLLPPAIPLVYETGKAALNAAYIEHLHSLMLGLICDERQSIPAIIVPRAVIDITARAEYVLHRIRN